MPKYLIFLFLTLPNLSVNITCILPNNLEFNCCFALSNMVLLSLKFPDLIYSCICNRICIRSDTESADICPLNVLSHHSVSLVNELSFIFLWISGLVTVSN